MGPGGAGGSPVGVQGQGGGGPGQVLAGPGTRGTGQDQVVGIHAGQLLADLPPRVTVHDHAHRLGVGLEETAQVGVQEGGALGGRGQDDVTGGGHPGQDVEAGDGGGAGPHVVGVEAVAHGHGPYPSGAGQGALVDARVGLATGQRGTARGVGNGCHEAPIAQGEALLRGQGGVEVGGHVQGPLGNGVQALGQERPVHAGVPALDDGGGVVVGGAGDPEALVQEGLADPVPSHHQDQGASWQVLAQHGGGVHGGGEDLLRVALNVVGPQFGHDLRGRPGGVVGDEGQAHARGPGPADALGGVGDPGVAGEADAVEIQQGNVVGGGQGGSGAEQPGRERTAGGYLTHACHPSPPPRALPRPSWSRCSPPSTSWSSPGSLSRVAPSSPSWAARASSSDSSWMS